MEVMKIDSNAKIEAGIAKVYMLENADIDTIIDNCNQLLADEKLIVYGFGENQDLELHIYKDSEYNPDVDEDYANLVTITTKQNGEPVDDTEDTYVTDGSLYTELERINNYEDFELL